MSNEDAPIVRIAEALEHIAKMLHKMAHPPMTVRGLGETVEFSEEGIKVTPFK